MLIGIFRTNQPAILYTALPVLTIILWIPGFLNASPLVHTGNEMPLYEIFVRAIGNFPYVLVSLAMILVYVQAILINNMVDNYELIQPRNNLTSLMYLILMSFLVKVQSLHPVIFSNLFLLLALKRICTVYHQKRVFSQAFDSGALIGLASLFYFPAVLLFFFLWASLIIIRSFVWREYIISLIGFIMPHLFIFVFYYLTNQPEVFLDQKLITGFDHLDLDFSAFKISKISVKLFLFLLLIASVWRMLGTIGYNIVIVQYILRSLMGFLFISVTIMLLSGLENKYVYLIAAIPASVFMANFFLRIKRKLFSEMIFMTFFILMVYNLFVN
jgi:hypothetical protein